jgi:hypothetical protein
LSEHRYVKASATNKRRKPVQRLSRRESLLTELSASRAITIGARTVSLSFRDEEFPASRFPRFRLHAALIAIILALPAATLAMDHRRHKRSPGTGR